MDRDGLNLTIDAFPDLRLSNRDARPQRQSHQAFQAIQTPGPPFEKLEAGFKPGGKVHQLSIRNRVRIPILDGTMTADLVTFHGLSDGREHIALQLGKLIEGKTPTVRLHSECLTGDVFGSARCDCGPQLEESIRTIEKAGGYLLYLRQEGRGIGLYNKVDAYALQDHGLDTYAANRRLGFEDDMRDFKCAAEMLEALGVHKVCLISNNPRKEAQLQRYGVEVERRSGTGLYVKPDNTQYLLAKRELGGHSFPDPLFEIHEVKSC